MRMTVYRDKTKAGRKPHSDSPRSRQIAIRLTGDEHAALSLAAGRDSRKLSDWVRLVAIRAAQEVK